MLKNIHLNVIEPWACRHVSEGDGGGAGGCAAEEGASHGGDHGGGGGGEGHYGDRKVRLEVEDMEMFVDIRIWQMYKHAL